MKMNEILIRHWRDRPASAKGYGGSAEAYRAKAERALVPRYYNGVLLRRTTISCVATAFLLSSPFGRGLAAGITFPLEVKWSAALPAPPAFAPAFDTQHVYVSLRSNHLVALRLSDGKAVWSVECPTTAAPAAGDGLIFVGNNDLIEARAAADGRPQWRRPIDGRVLSLYWDTGWLLAASETGPLLALRASDGEILWQRDLGAPLEAPPAPSGDRLYLSLKDRRILALSLQTGEEVWAHKLAEPAVGILPVGDRVFVGARDNYLHSLEADDASTDWKWQTGADVLGVPVLDEKRVYFVALDNVLRGHDRNGGSMLWKRVLPMRPFTGPILSGQTLIMAGVASELHAYNAIDGKPVKPVSDFTVKGVENEEMLLAAPPYLTSQDLLILVTKGGQVRGIGSKAETPKPARPAGKSPPTETEEPPGEPEAEEIAAPAVP
jgi:outer membrane protein assembly factor BamB